MIQVLWPWKNLGCLGFRIKGIYFDFFVNPYFGSFSSTLTFGKMWVRFWPQPKIVKRHYIKNGVYYCYINGKTFPKPPVTL